MSKITYDKQSQIMSIRLKKSKSVDSDVQDTIVIDYDKKGNIVNIDVMNISVNEFARVRLSAGEPVYAMKEKVRSSHR